MAADCFVYLLQTREDYERPTIIEAHLDEAAANSRMDVLNAYAARAPLPVPDVDRADEVWDAHRKAEAEWKAGHPLGNDPPGYMNQLYEVAKVPLVDPANAWCVADPFGQPWRVASFQTERAAQQWLDERKQQSPDEYGGCIVARCVDAAREYGTGGMPVVHAPLTMERIYELAKSHLSERGHELIWENDPEYAKACDLPKDARWSTANVSPEQTIAFARAVEAHVRGVPAVDADPK